MAKTYVQRIAEVVARKHNLSMKDAEAFVAAMFAVAHEGMEQDKQVKIKGLGTFKVVAVKSRESVNVNTGERIVLEGHDKVSFTPDTTMKELVNKPFAQFEAVVLNDGVDLENIDQSKTENAIEEQVIEEEQADKDQVSEEVQSVATEQAPEEVEQITANESVIEATPVEKDTTDEQVTEDDISEEYVMDNGESTATSAEPLEQEKTEEPAAETAEVTVTETSVETMTTNPICEVEEPAVQEDTDEEPDTREPSSEEETRNSHRRIWAILILGLLITAAVVGYFWYNQKQNEQPLPPLPKSMTEPTKPKPMKPAVSKPNAPKDTQADDLARANQDPRVRIGGYDIVGIDTVITLRGNQTMHSYCKHTLGKDMIVYFQALNGKDSMVAGEQMKVPKVKFRKRN